MRSIIGCNFCCLDNLFGTQTKIELKRYKLKISKHNIIVSSDYKFKHFAFPKPKGNPETVFDMIITIQNLKP